MPPTPILTPAGIKRLNQISDEAAKNPNLPPFVFGVTNADRELYFTAQGRLDYHDPTSPPLTPSSIFWICSMTKFIASIATLQLIDKNLLTLSTPISQFLPQFTHPVVLNPPLKAPSPTFKPAAQPITVAHLLNHSSGLYYSLHVPKPVYALQEGYTRRLKRGEGVQEFVKIIQGDFLSVPLKFEPGSNWTYGYSSDILGFLVEAVSGLSFEEYCQQNIFKPLSLTASFLLTPLLKDNLVRLIFRNPDESIVPWADQTRITEQDYEKVHAYLGGIGIYTSLQDYLTLLRHILLIKDGRRHDTPLLSHRAVESLFLPTLTPQGAASLDRFDMTQKNLQYSTGLALTGDETPGMRRKGSGFWGGWAGTSFFLDPETGIAVVFGTQLVPPGDRHVAKLNRELERALYAHLELFGSTETDPIVSSKL